MMIMGKREIPNIPMINWTNWKDFKVTKIGRLKRKRTIKKYLPGYLILDTMRISSTFTDYN
jgi:hypothetical protein